MEKKPSPVEINKRNTVAADKSTWVRSCVDCGTVRQLRRFGKNNEGMWYTRCPMCRQTRGIRERVKIMDDAKQERLKRGLGQMVAAARHKINPLPDIAEICSGMMAEFQGVKLFCQEWKEQIDAAEPGSKTRLDQYYTIFKMNHSASLLKREELALGTASPEELERAISTYVFNVLGNDEDVDEDVPKE